MSFLFVIFLYIIQSSAKRLILGSAFLQVTFTCTRNNSGHETLPYGTPDVTLTSLDSCPPILTLCVRSKRNYFTQIATLESTPEAASFISRRSRGIKSEALEKSIIIASTPNPVQRVHYVLAHCDDLTFIRVYRSKPMLSLV
jgi:hypothetical protein